MRSNIITKLLNNKFYCSIINKDLKYNHLGASQFKNNFNNYYVNNLKRTLSLFNKNRKPNKKYNVKSLDTTVLRSLVFPRFIMIYYQSILSSNIPISKHLKINLFNRLCSSINSKF